MKKTICLLFLVAVSLFLNGCGGGGSDDVALPSQTLFGTAAAGMPVTGSVYVRDSTWVTRGPYALKPNGDFSFSIAGLIPPFILKAEGFAGGRDVILYSIALEEGRTNINPITDLIVAVAAGANHGENVWDDPGNYSNLLNTASISGAVAKVRNLILPFLQAYQVENTDPLRDPIQFGAGLDAVIDRVSFEIQKANGTVTVRSLVNQSTLGTTTIARIGDASPVNTTGQPNPKTSPPVIVGWYGPSGMKHGVGLDAVSTIVAGTCVVWDDISQEGAVETYYKLEVIEDSSEVSKEMDIAATASVDVGLFSGSARGTFAKSIVKDTYSVHVIASVNISGYSFNLTNARLKSPWDQKFSTDWLTFRNTCGDRYLSTITTGGKFLGFLKITTTSDKEKKAVTANIKAKYAGVSGESDFKTNMDSVTKQYHAVISFYEMGPAEQTLPVNFAEFMNKLTTFAGDVSGCISNVSKCAYMVTFADYNNLASGSPDISKQIEAMNTLVTFNRKYDGLLPNIEYIRAKPELFVIDASGLATLKNEEKDVGDNKTKVLDAARACARSSIDCQVPPDLKDPAEVWLPERKEIVTQTCGDVKKNFPGLIEDNEYEMHFGGDPARKYSLYCHNMNSEEPLEYLTLQRRSPASTSPSFNYANSMRYKKGDKHTDSWTVYHKLRVMVSKEWLTVLRNDLTFAHTRGDPPSVDSHHTPYGEASTCAQHSDWHSELQGHANIDLSFLPFALDESVHWTTSEKYSDPGDKENAEYYNWISEKTGRPYSGTPWVWHSQQRVDLHIAGRCGYNKPSGDLILKWVGP